LGRATKNDTIPRTSNSRELLPLLSLKNQGERRIIKTQSKLYREGPLPGAVALKRMQLIHNDLGEREGRWSLYLSLAVLPPLRSPSSIFIG
jgi:hypothetical protein